MIVATYQIGSTAGMVFDSNAVEWTTLAEDLLFAIDRLEAINRKAGLATINRNILLPIDEDMQSISLFWCSAGGELLAAVNQSVKLRFAPLSAITDRPRDDGITPPNGSIDRAISKLAADMLSWSKDPETFELITHQRYRLFLRWPAEETITANEYAYGLWDE
jgi:hypothetical protein